jgi:hypothetical protein
MIEPPVDIYMLTDWLESISDRIFSSVSNADMETLLSLTIALLLPYSQPLRSSQCHLDFKYYFLCLSLQSGGKGQGLWLCPVLIHSRTC